MDKVKITQEQADAIETMKMKGSPIAEIVERHCDKELIQVNGWGQVLELSTDTLIRALYIGYEVEETPEDKVREYYLIQKAAVVSDLSHDKPTTAISNVLELLNIKIEGVNA